MTACPEGHDSASDDFCDVCGTRIGGNPGSSRVARSGSITGSAGRGERRRNLSGLRRAGIRSRSARRAVSVPGPAGRSPPGPAGRPFPVRSAASPVSSVTSAGGAAPAVPSSDPPVAGSRSEPLSSWSPPEPSPSSWSPPEPPPSSWSRPEPPAAPGGRSGLSSPPPVQPARPEEPGPPAESAVTDLLASLFSPAPPAPPARPEPSLLRSRLPSSRPRPRSSRNHPARARGPA